MKGRRPTITIGRAKKFAERQGYRWVPNPDADIPFDAFVYRGNDMFAVRVETSRNAPGEYDLPKDFFRKEFGILVQLPLPAYLPREVWVRYSWSRAFHRFRLVGSEVCEITMIDRELPVYPYEPVTNPSGGEKDGSKKDDLK
jgi:hypothetical protein